MEFDIAYSSALKRAQHSLSIILKELNCSNLPITYDWRLNERHYGNLIGFNKRQMADKYGEKQVNIFTVSISFWIFIFKWSLQKKTLNICLPKRWLEWIICLSVCLFVPHAFWQYADWERMGDWVWDGCRSRNMNKGQGLGTRTEPKSKTGTVHSNAYRVLASCLIIFFLIHF